MASRTKKDKMNRSQKKVRIASEDDSHLTTNGLSESNIWDSHHFAQLSERDDFVDHTSSRDDMKIFKAATARKILKEFDLEKTLEKYRGGEIYSYSRNPMDYDHELSLRVCQLNKKLRRLMGTEVINVNDPRYTARLRQRYWKEYEESLDKAEEARAEAERNRMRRLMREGIITYEELMQDTCIFKEKDREREREEAKLKSRRRKGTSSGRRSKRISSQELRRSEETMTPLEIKPSYSAPPTHTYSASPSNTRRAQSAQPNSQRFREGSALSLEEPKQESVHDELVIPMQPGRKCHSAPSERPSIYRPKRYEHPLVRKLRDEESVAGLYAIAEELVYLPDDVNKDLKKEQERKKREVPKPKRKTMFNYRFRPK